MSTSSSKKIAITLGDPNSISPEIVIKSLNSLSLDSNRFVLIGNRAVFDYYKKHFDLCLDKDYEIVEIEYKDSDIKPSQETKEAGEFAFSAIKKACDLVKNGYVHSIVTAPISKYALKLAGHLYSGQTEIVEKYIGRPNQKAQMLFVMGDIRVLLLTRHIALRKVADSINKDLIISEIKNLNGSLKKHFKVKKPKLALCSLNPHAGENGMFGDEEIKEYYPAIKELENSGILIDGPFPSDGLFMNLSKSLQHGEKPYYDCYVASYHDQGLIPVKLLGMDCTVNTTIGLDVVRTSPAHGTAFDIAGKNIASEKSMANAIRLALKML